MARTDLSLEELTDYRPVVAEPVDFDTFWRSTLDEALRDDTRLVLSPVEHPYRSVEILDATFAGFAGDPIRAWLTRPPEDGTARPAVVEFIGYNGGRDVAGTHLQWASAGFVHLLVDTRGQGSGWGGGGVTADPHGSGPGLGFVTRGLDDHRTYFYRRVFSDAVAAVRAVRALPGVDAARVSVTGISQGGGITLAAAGLVEDLFAVLPDVPFLSHFRRGVDICDHDPYAEIRRYLAVHRAKADEVFATLSYFDAVNFAKRASAPALFSVALMDQTCPPSTVYAAYHAYAGPRQIEVYPFNDHEGGASHHRLAQISWLRRLVDQG